MPPVLNALLRKEWITLQRFFSTDHRKSLDSSVCILYACSWAKGVKLMITEKSSSSKEAMCTHGEEDSSRGGISHPGIQQIHDRENKITQLQLSGQYFTASLPHSFIVSVSPVWESVEAGWEPGWPSEMFSNWWIYVYLTRNYCYTSHIFQPVPHHFVLSVALGVV